MLSGSVDKTVKLWDIDTLKFKNSYVGHTNWVNTASLSTDMNSVVSGGEDKRVIVWDQAKKKAIQKYELFDSGITKTLFHPT